MDADDKKNAICDDLCISLGLLPDSIKEIVSNRKFIIYDYGHHGKKWSLIYEEADSYNIKIGTTRNETPNLISKVDTTSLLDAYRNLICWGMDTLPYITKDMGRKYPKQWSGFYSSLSVFNNHSDCIFNSSNAIGFEDCDDMAINENFTRLCYLMYWLSAPEIRSLLPGFDDYVK